MDEMENQVLPREPEHKEESQETTVVTAEESAEPAQETAGSESAEEKAVPAEEAAAPEAPPAARPVQRPARHSPYENSPYMMPHQPWPQTQPSKPAPEKKAAEEKPARSKKGKAWLLVLVMTVSVMLLMFMSASWGADMAEDRTAAQLQALQEQIEVLQDQLDARENVAAGDSVSGTPNTTADGSLTPGQVFVKNEKSVVLIETDMATGSGFILTEDGYVVTNYHVVEDGSYISVITSDRADYYATLVGFDANNDVALLKMEGEGFPAVTLGSSDDLIVGDQVVAIGNPLGELTSTLTAGYVSAKERDVSTDNAVINMIQTDCAINSGNSGGPLFNMKGEVVGITTAKYSGTSSSGASIEGIGFAVPIDDVVDILEDLMEFGYVKSAYLGVSVYSMTAADAAMYGRPMGCLVDAVTPGSCAALAGVKPSDVIIGLGGHSVDSYSDLSRILREFEGGETTTITVDRNGKTLVLDIILDAKPQEGIPTTPDDPDMPSDGSYEEWYDYFFGE